MFKYLLNIPLLRQSAASRDDFTNGQLAGFAKQKVLKITYSRFLVAGTFSKISLDISKISLERAQLYHQYMGLTMI